MSFTTAFRRTLCVQLFLNMTHARDSTFAQQGLKINRDRCLEKLAFEPETSISKRNNETFRIFWSMNKSIGKRGTEWQKMRRFQM